MQGRVLQLTIKTYPEEADHLQQIHDELAGALQGAGIEELNLHVIQQKPHRVRKKLPQLYLLSSMPLHHQHLIRTIHQFKRKPRYKVRLLLTRVFNM